jgi:hypothetical protein
VVPGESSRKSMGSTPVGGWGGGSHPIQDSAPGDNTQFRLTLSPTCPVWTSTTVRTEVDRDGHRRRVHIPQCSFPSEHLRDLQLRSPVLVLRYLRNRSSNLEPGISGAPSGRAGGRFRCVRGPAGGHSAVQARAPGPCHRGARVVRVRFRLDWKAAKAASSGRVHPGRPRRRRHPRGPRPSNGASALER